MWNTLQILRIVNVKSLALSLINSLIRLPIKRWQKWKYFWEYRISPCWFGCINNQKSKHLTSAIRQLIIGFKYPRKKAEKSAYEMYKTQPLERPKYAQKNVVFTRCLKVEIQTFWHSFCLLKCKDVQSVMFCAFHLLFSDIRACILKALAVKK